jgi:hypothetical protein
MDHPGHRPTLFALLRIRLEAVRAAIASLLRGEAAGSTTGTGGTGGAVG